MNLVNFDCSTATTLPSLPISVLALVEHSTESYRWALKVGLNPDANLCVKSRINHTPYAYLSK